MTKRGALRKARERVTIGRYHHQPKPYAVTVAEADGMEREYRGETFRWAQEFRRAAVEEIAAVLAGRR